MNFKLIEALRQIETEKGLKIETVLEALSDALVSAYKKNYGVEGDARIDIDSETGEMKIFEIHESESGKTEEVEVTPDNFGRIAAQTAKQVIIQRIREAERELMFDEYHGREGDIVTGIVQQSDQRYTLVDLGKVEALLPPSEQVRGERYEHGARLKTYIVDVRRTTKGPQIMVSRTHPGLLKRLFELEVPEIFDGLVEIKAVAREAGQRSKVAVESNDPNVDPVGACVGAKGSRVRMIVSELRGEKVDIVEWKEDPGEFVANAISPAKVREVIVDPDNMTAEVIVPDNQLSLAIGKEGQNARLAAKLTGCRIDILSESQAMEASAIKAEQEKALVSEGPGQCRAITASGKRCRNKAKPGSEFCGMASHKKLAELIQAGSDQIIEVVPEEGGIKSTEASPREEKTEVAGEDVENEQDAGGEDISATREEEKERGTSFSDVVECDTDAVDRGEEAPTVEDHTFDEEGHSSQERTEDISGVESALDEGAADEAATDKDASDDEPGRDPA